MSSLKKRSRLSLLPTAHGRLLTFALLLAAGCARQQAVSVPEEELPLPGREGAIAAIEKMGGKIRFDEERPERPAVRVDLRQAKDPIAALQYLKELSEVQILDLSATAVTDPGLRPLEGLTKLRELILLGTEVGDQGMEHLKGLNELETLNLENTRITGQGLAHLAGLTSLRELNLALTVVADAGLMHLQGLTNLRSLNLHDTKLTGKGLANLAELKQLRVLRIDSNTQLTDAALVHLQGLTNLETVYLQNTGITDAGLVHLKGLTQLRQLYLYDDKVTDAGVKELQKAVNQVQVLR